LFTAGLLKTQADVPSQHQCPLTQRHSFVSHKTPSPPDYSISGSTTNLKVESEDNFRIASVRPQGVEKKCREIDKSLVPPSHGLYVVLPNSPWNRNAARKPLVVQLCAVRFRELYHLWTTLPSGVLLWGGVCFFCAFLWRRVSAFCERTDLLKWLMWRSNGFASNSVSNSTRGLRKHTECLKKQAYEWFKRFKNGWISVDDEESFWRPSTGTTTENVAKVWYWRHRE
jgi:hypothetical protein